MRRGVGGGEYKKRWGRGKESSLRNEGGGEGRKGSEGGWTWRVRVGGGGDITIFEMCY